MISEIKKAIPLEDVLVEVGMELRRGHARCPFHEDRNPSFSIKGDRWRCWSCGVGGDVIDFIKQYHNISTGEAVKLLANTAGLSNHRPDPVKVAETERKRKLVAKFRAWEKDLRDTLAKLLRMARQLFYVRGLKSWKEVAKWTDLINDFSYYEYLYEILCGSDDSLKFELYKQEMGLGG